MKKLLNTAFQSTKSLSKPLLLASFGGGYLLATLLFTFYRGQTQHILQYLFY